VATGVPILTHAERVRYEEIAEDLRRDYEATGRRDLREAGFRLAHLKVFFAGRRVVGITPSLITEYVVRRQREGAAKGTVNRELATLSRMLRVAYRNGKLHRLPVIERLEEAPPREGFFEEATLIADTFGWRIASEVLTLERRQLDLEAGTLRLEVGTTKNDDGRVVYLTAELEVALREQIERVEAFQRRLGKIIPWLFPQLRGSRHAALGGDEADRPSD